MALGRRLELRQRGAALAAALDGIPALAAGVLAAREAEVERPVERLELVRRRALLGLGTGDGERLVDRLIGLRDEVPETPANRPQRSEGTRPAHRRFEGVASAAALAERFGQDLGHRHPGYRL